MKDLQLCEADCNAHLAHPPPPLASPWGAQKDKEFPAPTTVEKHALNPQIRISMDLWEWYQQWLDARTADQKRVSIHDALSVSTVESREALGHGSPQTFRWMLDALTSPGKRYAIEGQNVVRRL
jgi:hypothetical protein